MSPVQHALESADGKAHFFIELKDTGLTRPSHDVVTICFETERCVKRILRVTGDKVPGDEGIVSAINTAVLAAVHHKVFFSLNGHELDTSLEENHVFSLIKTISRTCVKVLFHHYAKLQTTAEIGIKIRKQLSKLILFKYQ